MKGEGGLNFFGNNIFTRSNELCDSSSVSWVDIVWAERMLTFGCNQWKIIFVFNNRHKQNGHRERQHGDRLRPSRHGARRQAKLGGLERGQRPLG